jgi:flagellar biosynthetic protein FlhB
LSNEPEKTEKATPKRRERERDKGNIAKSQDMTSSVMLSAGIALLFLLAPNILQNIRSIMYETFTHLDPDHLPDISLMGPMGILLPYAVTAGQILAPFFILLAIAAFITLRLQVGALFAKEALKPKIDKLKPVTMLKTLGQKINIFAPKTMVEFVKSMAKLIVVATVGIAVIRHRLDDLLGLMGSNVETAFAVLGSVLLQLVTSICIIMIVIGVLDRFYQNYEYEKSIKMSKQEVKDEWKNMEGDPQVKNRIRSVQMKFAQSRMMGSIQQADVVVVNPTHYAVAIRYNQAASPAPQVLAKGVDFIAFKIREVAKAHNVPIVENKPLAQSLYKLVPIGGIIPPELYVAVAEVLSYVYKQRDDG